MYSRKKAIENPKRKAMEELSKKGFQALKESRCLKKKPTKKQTPSKSDSVTPEESYKEESSHSSSLVSSLVYSDHQDFEHSPEESAPASPEKSPKNYPLAFNSASDNTPIATLKSRKVAPTKAAPSKPLTPTEMVKKKEKTIMEETSFGKIFPFVLPATEVKFKSRIVKKTIVSKVNVRLEDFNEFHAMMKKENGLIQGVFKRTVRNRNRWVPRVWFRFLPRTNHQQVGSGSKNLEPTLYSFDSSSYS